MKGMYRRMGIVATMLVSGLVGIAGLSGCAPAKSEYQIYHENKMATDPNYREKYNRALAERNRAVSERILRDVFENTDERRYEQEKRDEAKRRNAEQIQRDIQRYGLRQLSEIGIQGILEERKQ